MLSDIIFAHILYVFLFILHGWLTGLQEDKVVSAVFFYVCVSYLDYITLPATLKQSILMGSESMYVSPYQCVCLSMCLLISHVVLVEVVALVQKPSRLNI